MAKGAKRKAQVVAPVQKSLPAQGTGAQKAHRSPALDPAAGGGKMHDDLKKSAKDDTLEHSIIAAFNCD